MDFVGTVSGQDRNEKMLFVSQHFFYHFFYRWVRHIFDADVLHVKVHKEKLDRPVIIVANHVSGWDPFLIFSILNSKFVLSNLVWRLPAARSQFKTSLHRTFFKLIGVYPIQGMGDLNKSLETTFEILDKGHNTVFFPEAKRTSLSEKVEPKKGIAHLIERKNVYILPIFLEYKRRNKNKKGVKIGKSRAVVGDLIRSEYFIDKYRKEERHKAVMSYVYDLEKHLISRFGKK